jgi:drug/metabolite transporter (DMT)-like permease
MLLSYFAGIISVFIWALLPVLVKSSFTQISVSYFLLIRFGLAIFVLSSLIWKFRRQLFHLQPKVYFNFLIVLGANYWLQCLAIKDLPVSWYIVIFSLNPFLSLLLMKTCWSQRLILSLILGIMGVLLFLFKDEQFLNGIPLYGFLYLVGGMLTWVLYTFMSKQTQSKISDTTLTLLTQILSFIAVFFIWLIDGFPHESLMQLNTLSWASIILSGVGLPVAYYLYLYSLRRTPIFSQLSQYLELLFGLLFSWLIYNEQITLFKILGGFFILLSLGLSAKKEVLNKEITG